MDYLSPTIHEKENWV